MKPLPKVRRTIIIEYFKHRKLDHSRELSTSDDLIEQSARVLILLYFASFEICPRIQYHSNRSRAGQMNSKYFLESLDSGALAREARQRSTMGNKIW